MTIMQDYQTSAAAKFW